MNQVLQTILHRRSIRRFDPRQIDEGALEQILQAGLYAPSAGGRQGPLFVVSQDREVNLRLGRIKRANSRPRMAAAGSYVSREQPSIADDPAITDAFYGAPTVVTLFGPKNFLFAPEDCAAAAENMLLAAAGLGLGSCFLMGPMAAFSDPALRARLELPEGYEPLVGVALGYAAPEHPAAPERTDAGITWCR